MCGELTRHSGYHTTCTGWPRTGEVLWQQHPFPANQSAVQDSKPGFFPNSGVALSVPQATRGSRFPTS